MTAFRTHAAALIDRARRIGRGLALAQHRLHTADAPDLYEVERLLTGLDLLRDLQRAEGRIAFDEQAKRDRSPRQVADGARGACPSGDRRDAVAGPIPTRRRDGSSSARTGRSLGRSPFVAGP